MWYGNTKKLPISIITRSFKSSELLALSENLNSNVETRIEVLAVCNRVDINIPSFRIFEKNVGRFAAKIEALKNAEYERILFIDSDQYPEPGLLRELESIDNDMVIIPERSSRHSITSTCLDDLRKRNEKRAFINPSPFIAVIPRYFKTHLLKDVIDRIPDAVLNITNHEDSVLYYEVNKLTNDVAISKLRMINNDPNILSLLKKAYFYGRNFKETSKLDLPQEITQLCQILDKSSLDVKGIGFGPGYMLQLLRAVAYGVGVISVK